MMQVFTRDFWANLWADLNCKLLGHLWGGWNDAHDGTYWRSCVACYKSESRPYIEMLIAQRRLKRDTLDEERQHRE